MIIHYALFQWKPQLSPQTLDQLRRDFAGLRSAIPEIRGFRWVQNNSTENLDKGFREGIRVEFDSIEARQHYLAHPDHVAFARERVIPALKDGLNSVLVFDYDDR